MVLYFNRKDLGSLSRYILELINTGKKKPGPDGRYETTQADIDNWLDSLKK